MQEKKNILLLAGWCESEANTAKKYVKYHSFFKEKFTFFNIFTIFKDFL